MSDPRADEEGGAEGTAETLAAPTPTARDPIPLASPSLSKVQRDCYEVGAEVARGGLGRILQAVDRRLDRPVAIKELLHDAPDHAARFAREALLTAKLQHPAIVPIYEAGLWPDGSPFYAMKLVSGKSLEAAVRERESLVDRLALLPHVIHVVEALAYAHDRRIIHRDLKPANVLVGAFGETVVIDWGLAKDLSETVVQIAQPTEGPQVIVVSTASNQGHTEAGSVLGTPAYMPPEQAMGENVDARADVYALGALLYHVICGAPPYSGTSSREILSSVVRESPEAIELREPGTPRELAAVVRKAMARDPDERYPTAAELAEDLHRYTRGLLVLAHEYSALTLVARWARRHRAPLAVAAAMLALLAAVVVVDVRRIVKERDLAKAERAEATRLRLQADARGDELALREAEELLPRDPRGALGWLLKLTPESGAYGAARVLAADALSRGLPRAVLHDLQAGALTATSDGALLAAARADDVVVIDTRSLQRLTLRGRGGDERALAFAPGGGKLAFAGAGGGVKVWDRVVRATTDLASDAEVTALAWASDEALVTGDRGGGVRVWGVGRGSVGRAPEGHAGAVLAVDARGARAVTGGADGVARLWDVAGPHLVATLPHGAPITDVRITARGSIVTVAADRRVRLWNADGTFGRVLGDHDGQPTALAVGPDDAVASGDARGDLVVWTEPPRRLDGHRDEIRSLVFSGDGLISAGRDGTIRDWDLVTGQSRMLVGHEGGVVALAGSGRLLASAARDRTVRLWDLDAGQPRVLGGAGRARALAVAGTRIVTAADGGEVRRWDAADATPGVPAAAPAPVRALALAGAGMLVAGAADGCLFGYDPKGGLPETLARLDGPMTLVAFDLRGRAVAGGGDGGLRLVDLTSGKERIHDAGAVTGLAFSPGGTLLCTSGADVRLWEVDRGKARILDGARGPFTSVACSAQLVAAGQDDGVAVWRVSTGGLVLWPAPDGPFAGLSFTPDGKQLIGRGERGVRIWDATTGSSHVLPGLGGTPLALAVSPDSRLAGASSLDGSARIWDLASGRGRTLAGHTGAVTGIAFLDGGGVVTSSLDGTVRIWPDSLPHEAAPLRAAIQAATR